MFKMKLKDLLYNPSFRALAFQAITLACLIFLGISIVENTLANLESRGIATGFDFLEQEAGFGIGLTLIDYDESYTYGQTFWVGLLNTALVSVLGIFFATLLGFIIGISRLSSNWLVKAFAAVYIEIFRNIPLLLQIFFWYFAVLQALPTPKESYSFGEVVFLNIRGLYLPKPIFTPEAIGIFYSLLIAFAFMIGLAIFARFHQAKTGKQLPVWRISLLLFIGLPIYSFYQFNQPISLEYPHLLGFNFQGGINIIPELAALVLALSIYTASFIAEIVRAGIKAIDSGQSEAAAAIGLTQAQNLRLIVIPQAMRAIIPPLTSQYLNLTKNSSLAMAIGYPDLVSVFAGTALNQTGQAIEIIAMTMSVYLALSLLTSLFMNIYNAQMALVER